MFEIASEQFNGPLELLLQLIETEKLSISEVSLAQVAESYLEYIEKHEPPADELADFLIVATKLLLIKSRAILPLVDEPEEDVSTLALQLRMYKEFVEASKLLETKFNSAHELFEREKPDVMKRTEFILAEGVNTQSLQESFTRILKQLEPFFAMAQMALERVVSVKERLQQIHESILSRARMTFADVVHGHKTKVEVVVSFLALLELVKQRVVHTMQSDSFSDIEIKRID